MKKLMLSIAIGFLLAMNCQLGFSQSGASLSTAIYVGQYSSTGGPTFSDTKNNSSYNGVTYINSMGQSSPEVYYRLTVVSAANLDFSLCGSNFDTYIHILNSVGGVVTYQDDSPDCGTRSHLTYALNPGTYYLAIEGYGGYTGDFTLIVSSLNSSSTNATPIISYTPTNILGVGSLASITPSNTGGVVGGGAVTSTFATGFYNPLMTACDASGNIYVADAGNHQIKKISPSGVVTVLAGSGYSGYADGTGTSAVFQHPSSVAVDASGNVFVADQQNHRIRRITPAGVVTTFAGSGTGAFANGTGTGASFQYPMGLVFDASGNLYVADAYNHRIRRITTSAVVTTFAGTGSIGSGNGAALSSTFNYPMGLAIDGSGNLIVADRYNHMVRKITSGGTVSTLAGSGSAGFADGTGSSAGFNYVNAVATDAAGNVYAADQYNNRVRKITPAGVVSTLAGNGTATTVNGSGATVSFNSPYGLSIDVGKTNLYVAENSANVIRKIALSGGGYSISPALPSGLTLDANTGIISGTPVSTMAATTYTVTATNSQGSGTATFTIRIVSNIDPYINSILTKSFDDDGVQISESKSFYSDNGRSLQSQVKSLSGNQVIASETLYDAVGRTVGSTLPAPINSIQVGYKPNFVANVSGGKYDYRNFDGSKLNTPDPLGNSSSGTLGWYYSNNNTTEPYVATTAYPYVRSSFYNDGTGGVKKSANVGEAHKMGSGYQSSSNTIGVINELDLYNQMRIKFFPESQVGNRGALVSNGMMTVSQDENGVQIASVTDLEGRLLMTAKPGAGSGLTVTNSANVTNQSGYVFEVDWSDNGAPIVWFLPTIKVDGGYIEVYKSTNNWVTSTNVFTGLAVDFDTWGSTEGKYRITSSAPFKVSYQVGTNNNQDIAKCKACDAKPASDTKDQIYYFRLFNSTNVTISGSGWKLFHMSGDEQEIVTGSPVSLPTGYYKVTVPQTGSAAISYSTVYSDISYNFYNQLGQLIGTIAPEGVKAILNNGLSSYATFANVPFISTYEYDLLGRQIANTQTDAGRTEFIYRRDGKIRFTQNTLQRDASPKRFTYANYDRFGRVFESGELVESGAMTFINAKTNATLQESVAADGGLTGTRQGWVKSYYENVNSTHGVSGYSQNALNLRGSVSWTENSGGSKTWYNYDGESRLAWVVRAVPGLGNKTIDYIYDAKGNVSKVDFQKDVAAERFTHEYEFDADNRLTYVYTTAQTSGKKLQARYYFYVHGPLKRVELGTNLQGIDYVYTAQGTLKSINHPTESNDPGKDGIINSFSTDVFGQTLEYFSGDYTRSNTNINSLNTGGSIDYSGNIMGQSWRSQKPNAIVSTYGASVNNPAMVTYAYDDKYQFSNNKFGAPNFGSNTFSETVNANREHGLSYDANGNITALNRTNSAGTSIAGFTYNYQANTNKLNSVSGYASYTYDALGQMSSQIRTAGSQGYYVDYDVNGKVTAIYSNAGKTNLRVSFGYDESGNRVRKTDHILNQITYYVYDLEGNVLAVYDNKGTGMQQNELPVYAASRVGNYIKLNNAYQYELTDHLGNVRAVINEAKQGNGKADVVYYSDYYPYGSPMTLANSDYRYGYQGQYAEVDKETGWNNFDLRMYDAAIGRWMSTDPAGQFHSPYVGMGNEPVSSIDPDGAYSILGAAWRQALAFVTGLDPGKIYHNGNTWGFNTKGKEGFIANFSDQKSKVEPYINKSYEGLLARQADWRVGYYNSYTGKTNGWGGIEPNYFFEELAIGGAVAKLPLSSLRFFGSLAGKGGGRVFWSGGDVAKNAAMDFAITNGMKTLEMTTSGRIMNYVGPYLPRSISRPIWDRLSSNFARGASGNINVFQNAAGVSLKSTWRRIEYPILQNNDIFYHIVK